MNNTQCRRKVLILLICGLIGVICMAIASKNSFLYAFNESVDVNVFVVTVRGMLKGQVLYRDIYDHKGPLLYLLYYVGMYFNNTSLVGVYIIECILFSWYIYNMYRIASLYEENEYIKIVMILIGSVLSCGGVCFLGGGQCEELALPFLSGIIYYVLRYYHCMFPNNIPIADTIRIGALISFVFWMKYSLLGMVVGIAITLAGILFAFKQLKLIIKYLVGLVIGFATVSIPILSYFLVTNSLGDLFQVYFYDNIFKYSGIDYGARVTPVRLLLSEGRIKMWFIPILCVLVSIAGIVLIREKMNRYELIVLIGMLISTIYGVTVAHVWLYSTEILCVYSIIAVLYVYFILKQYLGQMLSIIKLIIKKLNMFFFDSNRHDGVLLLLCFAYAILERKHFVINFIVAIIVLQGLSFFVKCTRNIRLGWTVPYIVLFALYFHYDYEVLSKVLVFAFVLIFIVDLCELYKYIKSRLILVKTKNKKEKVLAKLAICIFLAEFLVLSLKCIVPYSTDIGKKITEYPTYQMTEYIKDSGVEHPVVINYDCLDNGVYLLMDEYPIERRFANNNASKEEVEDMATKWIYTGKADFLVASYFAYPMERCDVKKFGYNLVYYQEYDYECSGQKITYCMFEKIER